MDTTSPALKLLLDTGHAMFAGADPTALARRHHRRIAHVHCKDVRAAVLEAALRTSESFLDAVVAGVFTVPGDGVVDFPCGTRRIARLRRLAGRRGRAGSCQSASADLCKAWLQ